MCGRSGRQRVMAGEGLAEGVDRAGADVAEDDADRADRQLQRCRYVDRARTRARRACWVAALSLIGQERKTSAFLAVAPARLERRAA